MNKDISNIFNAIKQSFINVFKKEPMIDVRLIWKDDDSSFVVKNKPNISKSLSKNEQA